VSPCPSLRGPGVADVILIATILVFFLAAAQLVRALGRVIAGSGDDAGLEDEAGPEDEGGRWA
jgi:hypothetical protein